MYEKPYRSPRRCFFTLFLLVTLLAPVSAWGTFTIQQRNMEDITILELSGDITIGEGDVMLRDAVLGLLNMGEQNIVLYLKNVGNVDSSGIGELLSVLTKVTERGGRLVLCAVPMVIHNLLAAEQIATVFEIYDTQEEAVQSFSEAK